MRYLPGLFLLLLTPLALGSSAVFERAGDIYYQPSDALPIQLTHTGQNYTPVLSPSEKIVAFVRIGKTPMPERCTHFANTHTTNGEQVWIIDITHQKEKLLVDTHYACDSPTDRIVDPQDLAFSPDNKTIYFITTGWTTSGALHAIQVDGTHLRYIMPANELQMLMKGDYKGHLLVRQHRYWTKPLRGNCVRMRS